MASGRVSPRILPCAGRWFRHVHGLAAWSDVGGRHRAGPADGYRADACTARRVAARSGHRVPRLFWGGLWLWRKQPLGHVVGGSVLLKAAAEGPTLVVQTVATLLMSGVGDDLLPAYALVGFGGLVLLVRYLRSVVEPARPGTTAVSRLLLP